MKIVPVHDLFISAFGLLISPQIGQTNLSKSLFAYEGLKYRLDELIKLCADMELPVARANFEQKRQFLENARFLFEDNNNYQNTWRNIEQDLASTLTGLERELSLQRFLLLQHKDVEFYEAKNLLGDKVVEKFPEIAFDIDEAGKCLALHRPTAAVFHLMRITEAGLMAIAKRVNVADTNPNWNLVLNAINKELNNQAQFKPAGKKAEQAFLSHTATHMNAVRIAWRNNVMHLEQKYTEEEALSIFHATKGLMDYLAEHL